MTGRRPGRPVGFGAHQALEYLLAALVISTGVRARTGVLVPVLAAGLAVLALAAVTDGPLAALRGLSRRAHAAADWVLVAGLAVTPLVAVDLGAHLAAAVVLWLAAAALAFLARSTDYRGRPGRRQAAAPVAPVMGSHALNDAARRLGRQAGRAPRSLGRAVGRYQARDRRFRQ